MRRFISGESNASVKYGDDRVLRGDLTQQCYGGCCKEWPLFFPAQLKNGEPSPYAKQLDLYLDKVFLLGAHGLYLLTKLPIPGPGPIFLRGPEFAIIL